MRLSSTAFFLRFVLFAAFAMLLAWPAAAQAPTWVWGLQTTNPAPTDGTGAGCNSAGTDAIGNVYVGGTIGSAPIGGLPTGVRSFGSAGTLRTGGFVAQTTAAGRWNWRIGVSPVGTNIIGVAYTTVTGVAVTAAGDVYVVGLAAADSLTVGNMTQKLTGTGYAVWAARLNSAGICQWIRSVLVAGTAPAVALDPSTGGVVVADAYLGNPTFGAITLPATFGFRLGKPLFVARLSATGQWTAAVSSTGGAGVEFNPVLAVGPAGQVAVGGRQEPGVMLFGAVTSNVPFSINASFVVAQLSPANQWQWVVSNNSGHNSETLCLAYTATGALWMAGSAFNGTTIGPLSIIGPVVGGTVYVPVGFIAQLSPTGQWTLAQQLPTSTAYTTRFSSLGIDGNGDAVVLGYLASINNTPVQLPIGNFTLTAPATGNHFFLATLSTRGQWRYITTVPLAARDFGLIPLSLTLDGTNTIYIAGQLQGNITFGNSALTGSYNTASTFGYDAFLAKLTNATALASHSATTPAALACFPNPAHAQATLHLPATSEAATAALLNALGHSARTYPLPAHTTTATLDLTGLAPGLYVVRCGAASGKLVVE